MPSSSNRFEAAASALGYAFQFRYALARALEALFEGAYDWTIAIESADDVEMIGGSSRELRQLKQVGRSISDASPDLWKTLRIWADGVKGGHIDLAHTNLYLITTGQVSPNSAPSLLGTEPATRDPIAAEAKLLQVCVTSSSETNKNAYLSFEQLTNADRAALLRAMTVVSNTPDIQQVRDSITAHIRIGSRREYVPAMVERLEGWWLDQCIASLVNSESRISAETIDSYISDLRDQFSPNNLPIDLDITDTPDPDVSEFASRNFVRQAKLALVGNRRLQIAVRDYLRTFAQRSRWMRLNLTSPGELDSYERRLIEEWEIAFEQLRDDLPQKAAEDIRSEMARQIYRWAETADIAPVRTQCTEPFIKRGSFHILADQLSVGWHPDFLQRLADILDEAG